MDVVRRRLMFTSLALPLLPVLQGCTTALPPSNPDSADDAHALLMLSATAHGLAALREIHDVNLRYEGKWRPIVGKLQPELVDAGYRGTSEERLLLQEGLAAQAYIGPSGRKQVIRPTAANGQGDVRVWFNGEEAHDKVRRAAAALVADGYSLFLLGPMLLAGAWSDNHGIVTETAAAEKIVLDGRRHECDVVRIRIKPGLGFSQADELALYIDRSDRLMRCVRFTLGGLESTQGAIAEVQTFDHVTVHGVTWPTRFYERLLRPLPLPVHDWRLTGLDVNRGVRASDISDAAFRGTAAAPAIAISG